MNYYEPDSAVVIKISDRENKTHYRVFGAYLGSYLQGSSYRINSGITKVKYDDFYFYFEGESGSVYKCRIAEPRLDAYCNNILQQICEHIKGELGSVEVINMPEVKNKLTRVFDFEELEKE